MATVITNRTGTYFANVNSLGQLEVSVGGGGGIASDSHTMGWDGSGWQNIHTTQIAGNYLLDVNVAGGHISIDPGEIRIGAVEIQDHDTTVRARVPLIDTSESYVGTDDAGLLIAWIDENGKFNYPVVDSSSHALRSITYDSVAFDSANNVFRNQIWGLDSDETTFENLSVITDSAAYTGNERGLIFYGTDGSNWLPIKLDTLGHFEVVVTSGSGSIYSNQVSVPTAGIPVQISTSVTISKVIIKANSSNTGNIYVGNHSVSSSNGLILEAGESVDLTIDDLSKVFIDADVSGEGISYIAS